MVRSSQRPAGGRRVHYAARGGPRRARVTRGRLLTCHGRRKTGRRPPFIPVAAAGSLLWRFIRADGGGAPGNPARRGPTHAGSGDGRGGEGARGTVREGPREPPRGAHCACAAPPPRPRMRATRVHRGGAARRAVRMRSSLPGPPRPPARPRPLPGRFICIYLHIPPTSRSCTGEGRGEKGQIWGKKPPPSCPEAPRDAP